MQLLQEPSGAIKVMMLTRTCMLLLVVHALKEAGKDSRVKGLVGVMASQPAGQMAQIQELRDAVLRVRCVQAAWLSCIGSAAFSLSVNQMRSASYGEGCLSPWSLRPRRAKEQCNLCRPGPLVGYLM